MNVLQVVLNLDYGGVESYVIRISKAMVRAGHHVTVLSQGGPMTELLQDSGVGLITSPLNSTTLPKLIGEIKDHGFDIINAHNYNSGRIGCPIARGAGIPYVLTVHGPRGFFRRVLYNCWSDRVIALSGADKRGISGFLGRSPDHVFTSFCPISTDVYYPRETDLGKKREFLSEPDGKLIVHISRFSNRKAKVAFELIKALPAVLAEAPDARLLIVGSGPKLNEISKRADEFNRDHGDIIRVDGPRPDVSDLYNIADVVVATAATAMEAMACGASLVAAGRTGYLGRITEHNFDDAHDLLFADHGRCPRQTSATALAADILEVLGSSTAAGSTSQALAARFARDFTPDKAAENVITLYERVIEEAR